MKEFKVEVPEGYEIDKVNSTFDYIKFKKVDEPMTWERLIAERPNVNTYVMKLRAISPHPLIDKWVAELKIYHLISFYGGCITDEEWADLSTSKYAVSSVSNYVRPLTVVDEKYSLAFKTEEHRDSFMKHNRNIVKDYLGIKNK